MKKIAMFGSVVFALAFASCAHKSSVSKATPAATSIGEKSKPTDSPLVKLRAYEAMFALQMFVDDQFLSNISVMENVIEKANVALNNLDATNTSLRNQWRKLATATRRHHVINRSFVVLRAFDEKPGEVIGTAENAVAEATQAVSLATMFEIDKKLESELKDLARKARIGFAEHMVQRLQDCVNGKTAMWHDAVTDAVKAVDVAFRAGDNVGGIVTQLYGLRLAACAKDETVCQR